MTFLFDYKNEINFKKCKSGLKEGPVGKLDCANG